MGRTHSPKGQIVLRKKEKLEAVKAAMPVACSREDFAAKFQEMYPEDWNRIILRYEQHERNSGGKGHPMAEPWQYLLNMVEVFMKAQDAD